MFLKFITYNRDGIENTQIVLKILPPKNSYHRAFAIEGVSVTFDTPSFLILLSFDFILLNPY